MLLATKQQHKAKTQNRNTQQRRLNTQKRTARKNIDQVGKFQEAPHLQDSIQTHSEYSKCWNSKTENFLYWATLESSLRESLEAPFILRKDIKTDHQRDKEIFRTTKPQKPVKLTIDNSQLNNNRDIAMNMRHMNHVNTCKLWLRTCIKDITRYTLRTSLLHI
jgi:hypothetical protein